MSSVLRSVEGCRRSIIMICRAAESLSILTVQLVYDLGMAQLRGHITVSMRLVPLKALTIRSMQTEIRTTRASIHP